MELISEPKELSISQLLRNDKYIIPLYQRNYAWTELEISQLLQDVCDKSNDTTSNYYVGTLVVFYRLNGSKFELIDGQQRHTTITLINAVLKGAYHVSMASQIANISFDARKEIQDYIDKLFYSYDDAKNIVTANKGLINIKNAVRIIEDFFKGEEINVEKYACYLYNNVKIIRIGVPDGTDINHYFEVMNNRGEQLEKHEILKAKFISKIDEPKREEFAMIWDAISQMDKHIQSCFTADVSDVRTKLFGNNFTDIKQEYLKILENLAEHNAQIVEENIVLEPKNVLRDILTYEFAKNENSYNNSKEREGKYKSIIDFPNFLLQVLRLKNLHVSLDDKKLLDEFGYTKKIEGRTLPNPIEFINDLFFYRILFDKYIIKREEGNDDWSWSLLKPANGNGQIYYKDTFGKEDEDGLENQKNENKEFLMLQSMLHVSFAANNYKNWLFEVLVFFKNKVGRFTTEEFKECLSNIAYNYYQNNEKIGFNKGTGTPRYLFNYLDYKLWSKYDRTLLKEEDKRRFIMFKFLQNNSVEHLHPQKDLANLTIVEDNEMEPFNVQKKILDSFGNLCLISQSSNSKYNDYNFFAKRDQFRGRKSVESLKQVIMFSYDQWNTKEILDHEKKMHSILNDR